jgi:hypothetical protein
MLNAHSEITVPPECGFALWLAEKYRNFECNLNLYERYAKAVFKSKKFETWGVSTNDLLEFFKEKKPKNYPEIVNCVNKVYAKKRGKNPKITGDKNNYYINHLDEIDNFFPFSKILFIIRDGRDVACSYKKVNSTNLISKYRPVLHQDIKNIAVEWKKNADIVSNYLKMNSSVLIKYEDLLKNTQFELNKICCFLNIKFNRCMLNYYERNDEPLEFLQWKKKTLQKPDVKNINKYKEELDKKDVEIFEEIAGEALKKFGYEV